MQGLSSSRRSTTRANARTTRSFGHQKPLPSALNPKIPFTAVNFVTPHQQILTRIQRAHAASTRQQSANLPLLQNPTGLFEENLRVFNCRPLSATAGDQRFLLLDHSVDLLPRHSCEPFSWRLVVRRNVVGSVNVDIDACRFLHDTPPFQSALSSSPRTTRFSHSLYPHRRAWIVVHSEQEAPARSCGKPVAVVRA